MRDYRIPMTLAVPAAIGLFAVLWLLRRKSSSDGGKKKLSKGTSKEKEYTAERQERSKVLQRTQHNGKEDVTVTRRKIPEVQARDRGSSDLQDHQAPDVTAGEKNEKTEVKENMSLDQKGVSLQASPSDLGVDNGLTASQRMQVDQLISTAIGEGLHEAQGKLSKQPRQSDSLLERSTDSGVLSGSPSSERLEAFKVVEEVLIQKGTATGFETAALSSESLEKGVSLKAPITIQSDQISDKESHPHASKVTDAISEEVEEQLQETTKSSVCDTQAMPKSPSGSQIQDKISPSAAPAVANQPASDTPLQVESQMNVNNVFAKPTDLISGNNLILERKKSASTKESGAVLSSSADAENCPTNVLENNDTQQTSVARESVNTLSRAPENTKVSDNNNSTVSSSQRLPSDRYGPRVSSSPLTKRPLTSSSSVDSASSFGPEEIESIWGLTPNSVKNVDKFLFCEDTDTSVSKVDSSSSSDQNVPQNDSSTSSGVAQKEAKETSNRDDKRDKGVITSAADRDSKEESPAKSNSPVCDNNSEGSNDSGRGGSEHDVPGQGSETLVHFDFNMPSELCGRFIGKHGKNINYLKTKTGAHVSLTNNPFTAEYQICQVVGTQAEVDDAVAMIRRKFALQDYPLLTMVPINMSAVPAQPDHPMLVPDIVQLSLPEGVSVDVYVSAIVDAGQVFVQQPTHRSFMSLEKLNYFLNLAYGQDPNVPGVPTPVECGVICVCENEGFWYRAMIMSPEDENGDCQVKFVDYGGYAQMPVTALKQIRTDFMSLPFQAVECFMANITPNQDEPFFSEEATVALSEMTQGKLLQCQVVARTENGTPYIHLYQISPESNSAVMINRALVNSRLVRWIEIL